MERLKAPKFNVDVGRVVEAVDAEADEVGWGTGFEVVDDVNGLGTNCGVGATDVGVRDE